MSIARATVARRGEPKSENASGLLGKARRVAPDAAESGPARIYGLDLKRVSLYPPGGRPAGGGFSGLLSALQAKLAVGSVDDPLEREADQVADKVLRMPDPASEVGTPEATPALPVTPSSARLSRKCASCKDDEDEKGVGVQRHAAPGAAEGLAWAPSIVEQALGSGGRPLDAGTQAYFGPRFRFDLSKVRIHTDARAEESARAVNALAYTVGRDIVFGHGEYQPDRPAGARLLAHELAHVVQQDGGTRRLSRQTPSAPDDSRASALATPNGTAEAPRVPKATELPNQPDNALGPECRADEEANAIPADSKQQDPKYLRRELTPAEHAYVNALEDKRVAMSLAAVQKLLQLRQDIITGNPDLQLHPEGRRKESEMPKPTGNEDYDAKARKEVQEKDFTRRTAVDDLNLASFFAGPINWNWLSNEAAANALEQIAQAEGLIVAQASKRLPRVVLPYVARGTLAAKLLAEDRLGFNPCFFVAKGYNDQRCWTWILMHEYFHSLGVYHGQIVLSKPERYPSRSHKRAITDVDYLTRLVIELALGSPFTTDCHASDA